MIFAPEQARDLLYSTVADMTNDPADGEDYMYICPPNMFSTIRKALHITMRFRFIRKNRPIFIGNLGRFWVQFHGFTGNASYLRNRFMTRGSQTYRMRVYLSRYSAMSGYFVYAQVEDLPDVRWLHIDFGGTQIALY